MLLDTFAIFTPAIGLAVSDLVSDDSGCDWSVPPLMSDCSAVEKVLIVFFIDDTPEIWDVSVSDVFVSCAERVANCAWTRLSTSELVSTPDPVLSEVSSDWVADFTSDDAVGVGVGVGVAVAEVVVVIASLVVAG